MNSQQNIYQYTQRITEIDRGSVTIFENIPMSLREAYTSMLFTAPNHRLDLVSLQSSPYFDNILVSTISFLENFVEKSAVRLISSGQLSYWIRPRKFSF